VTKLVTENEHLKLTYKQFYDSIKSLRVRSKEQCDDLIKQVNIKSAENSDLNASLQEKVLVITALKDTLSKLKGKAVVNEAVTLHPIDPELLKIDVAPLAPKLQNNRTTNYDYLKHTQEETATLREIVKNKRLLNPLNTSLDYAYGVDLLTGSRGNNLYTLSLGDMIASSPFCLLSKASKTKSWLWHRRLSHLNFGTINHLARHGLVRGLPKLKFKKDHLCLACAMGKRLVPKPSFLTPYVPPSRNDWDLLFQPLFDELLTPPPSVNPLAPEVIAPIADVIPPVQAESTGTPSSTIVDQDAPSSCKSQTTPETQSSVIPQAVEEDIHDIKVAHMGNDPLFGVPIPEVASAQSSSTVSPHTIVQPNHQIPQHNSKWTKDHPLDNIISQLSRLISTRLQLHEQALFCYYDAFLTSMEPKTYKDALTQSCWSGAMQEELNEFERLEVWELVPRPDKVIVITLK
nr:integrase, catalytic region, zinc finger, CCHC-type, peptidase aspartic, catalytic [Tanacetum cinerariifolium]